MIDSPEVEEAKQRTVRSVRSIPELTVCDEVVDPWILVDYNKGRVRITVNSRKLYRSMNNKNLISQGIDVLLTDEIITLLDQLDKREWDFEKEEKKINEEEKK